MIEYETSLKSWGNSIGVIIPKEELQKENLSVNNNVTVIVMQTKKVKVKDLFGKLENWKKPTSQIIAEARSDLNSKFVK